MDQTPKNANMLSTSASIKEAEFDLLAFTYNLLDHWKLLVISLLVCAGLSGAATKLFLTPTYEAVAKMYVLSSRDSVVNLSDLQLGTYLASDYQEVFYTHEVTEKVIRNLNLPYSVSSMQRKLSLSNPSGTRILYIKVSSSSAAEAAAIANEYFEVASQYVSDVMVTDRPTLLSSALVPTLPMRPSMTKNTLLGAMAGFAAAFIYLLVRFLLDDKLKTGEDITRLTGLPVLAQIPVFHQPELAEQRRAVHGRNDTL